MKGQNFSSQVLSRHTFRILRKKGSDFFDHRGTLSSGQIAPCPVPVANGCTLAPARGKQLLSVVLQIDHLIACL